MPIIVCERTRIIWNPPTASKQSQLRIIRFILTELNNDQHPCNRIIFDEDGALEKPTEITDLLADEFNIDLGSAGVDTSWLNDKNESHNINIPVVIRVFLLNGDMISHCIVAR